MVYTTKVTNDKRKELKARLDEFATFSWGGKDMFKDYGAVIVGGQGELKFYNSPEWSNEYSQPQFDSARSILKGITFNTQKISFTMGVYWFTIEEYKNLLMTLHPYSIDSLVFSFAPSWRYNVKLASYGDSPRYPIGRDTDGNIRYYTEIKLTFEVQGEPCLYSTSQYIFEFDENENEYYIKKGDSDSDFQISDLDTPIIFTAIVVPNISQFNVRLTCNDTVLFDFNIKDASWNENSSNIVIKYHSELGLVFMKYGESIEKLLTLQTSTQNGSRLVQQLQTNKFYLPGRLTNTGSINFWNNKISFKLTLNGCTIPDTGVNFECYARTNII